MFVVTFNVCLCIWCLSEYMHTFETAQKPSNRLRLYSKAMSRAAMETCVYVLPLLNFWAMDRNLSSNVPITACLYLRPNDPTRDQIESYLSHQKISFLLAFCPFWLRSNKLPYNFGSDHLDVNWVSRIDILLQLIFLAISELN